MAGRKDDHQTWGVSIARPPVQLHHSDSRRSVSFIDLRSSYTDPEATGQPFSRSPVANSRRIARKVGLTLLV